MSAVSMFLWRSLTKKLRMVGETFTVIFTRKAQDRRQKIIDFETRRVSILHALKIDRETRRSARKLMQLPEICPPLPNTEEIEPRIRYV